MYYSELQSRIFYCLRVAAGLNIVLIHKVDVEPMIYIDNAFLNCPQFDMFGFDDLIIVVNKFGRLEI